MDFVVKRRLRDLTARIGRTESEIGVLEAQLVVLNDGADDARVRSLVSDSPYDAAAAEDAQRHRDVIARERDRLIADVAAMRTRRDELLDQLAAKRGRNG